MAASSLASVRERPPRLREVAAPGWRRWASPAALVWALGYGLLRVHWALGTAPSPPPVGSDLIVFTGWWAVALCAAAAVVVVAAAAGMRGARWRRPLAVAAWGVTAVLAGTVLPLALVYRWGRVFPGWVPLLAGRGVPRWLVLGPALGLGAGMTAYFGVTMVKVAAATVTGTWAQQGFGSLPLWFFWVAVPGYLAWGMGLGIAGLAYRRATRPPAGLAAADQRATVAPA